MVVRFGTVALPAVRAASMRMRVASHNIANLTTVGFFPHGTISEATPDGGVEVKEVSPRDPRYPRPSYTHRDVAGEIVTLMQAKHAYSASLAVIKTEDQTVGALIDVLA